MRVNSSRPGDRSTFISTMGDEPGSISTSNSMVLPPSSGGNTTSRFAGRVMAPKPRGASRNDFRASTGSWYRSSPSTVMCRGRDMIWFQSFVGLPWFMLKIVTRPPFPSGVAEGAWSPEGLYAPKLNLAP